MTVQIIKFVPVHKRHAMKAYRKRRRKAAPFLFQSEHGGDWPASFSFLFIFGVGARDSPQPV